MEAEWSEAEIIDLINFYETDPCLYDPAVKDYKYCCCSVAASSTQLICSSTCVVCSSWNFSDDALGVAVCSVSTMETTCSQHAASAIYS